jgi:hypothetical protein
LKYVGAMSIYKRQKFQKKILYDLWYEMHVKIRRKFVLFWENPFG